MLRLVVVIVAFANLITHYNCAPVKSESVTFNTDSEFCRKSAKKVHGDRDPNAELNHYLECLRRKTDRKVDNVGEAADPELLAVSDTLTKILNNPLFREDVEKKRFRRSAPLLDENILTALVRNPEALKLVSEFLAEQEKKTNPTPRIRYNLPDLPPLGLNQVRKPPPQFLENLHNPMIKGEMSDEQLELFGPDDFKPDRPFNLPGGLEDEAVLPWQGGFIPIPR